MSKRCCFGGCHECVAAPDMKALVDASVAKTIDRLASKTVEEGFAIAFFDFRDKRVLYMGTPYSSEPNTTVWTGSVETAQLYLTREDAVDAAASKEGPVRIVHIRRFPQPAPILLGHSPAEVLDALAEVR